MKLLLTGFAPFGGECVNPSWEAVKRVDARGVEVIRAELPVSFTAAPAAISALLGEHRPDAVLLTGQAGGRAALSVERVAINLGRESAEGEAFPIIPGGKDAYFSTLPVDELVRAVRAAGIPAYESLSAGAYVCNCSLYTALALGESEYPGLRAGFIHLPYSSEQAAAKPNPPPSVSIDVIARALGECIKVIASGK